MPQWGVLLPDGFSHGRIDTMTTVKKRTSRKALLDASSPDHEFAVEGLSDYLAVMSLLFKSISQVLSDECRLTTLQYRMLLRLLATNGKPMRTTDLAENLYVGASTVSAAVPKLVEDGLVRRLEDPDDMRVVSLVLEPAGFDEIERADRCVGEFLREYWKNLTAEQLKAGIASSVDAVRLHGAERIENGRARHDTAFFDTIMISRTLTTQRLSEAGLRTQEMRILLALRILGLRITATQLARHLFLKSSDMTAPLKILELKGYIMRERDDDNRRIKLVSLTPEGREKVEKLLPITWDALLETCHSNERAVQIHLSAARDVIARERAATFFS